MLLLPVVTIGTASASYDSGVNCTHSTYQANPANRWVYHALYANFPIHEHQYSHQNYGVPGWFHIHYDYKGCPSH